MCIRDRNKADKKNLGKILKQYDVIVDGTDNFKAKFLLNKFSLEYKKKLIIGAISKFEGHIFTFDFNLKKSPCLKCFYQGEPAEGVLDCETDGILGSTAVITGSLQANEVLKAILNVGKNLNSHILIIDLLNLKFRKVLFRKRKGCVKVRFGRFSNSLPLLSVISNFWVIKSPVNVFIRRDKGHILESIYKRSYEFFS